MKCVLFGLSLYGVVCCFVVWCGGLLYNVVWYGEVSFYAWCGFVSEVLRLLYGVVWCCV